MKHFLLSAAVTLWVIPLHAETLPLCHPNGKLGFYPKDSIQTCLYRVPHQTDEICRFFRILPKNTAGAHMECKPLSEWQQ
jgi:hypothetical protein